MNSEYIPKTKEQVYELIRQAQQGNANARERLILDNASLVKKIASKFACYDYDVEDVIQIGYIGLIKAVDKFDETFNVMFSTYAVPVIIGEIKRYMRDDGPIKVSRTVKANIKKVKEVENRLLQKSGSSPRISQIALVAELTEEEVWQALEAMENISMASIEAVLDERGDYGLSCQETIKGDENLDDMIEIRRSMEHLSPRDRSVIQMRYYSDFTQAQVAKRLGISQVQVSRIEKRVINMLRDNLMEEIM